MKKFLVVIISYLFVFSASAQLDKGTLLIGGQGAVGGGFSNKNANYNLYFNPNRGLFVAPKFAIGSSVGFQLAGQSISSSPNVNYRYGSVFFSPFARYYFLKKENKFNIFGQANVALGGAWSNNFPNSPSSRFQVIPGLTAGVAYFIRPQIALEAAIVANFDPNVAVFSPFNQLRGVIGFQIHLDRKPKTAEVTE